VDVSDRGPTPVVTVKSEQNCSSRKAAVCHRSLTRLREIGYVQTAKVLQTITKRKTISIISTIKQIRLIFFFLEKLPSLKLFMNIVGLLNTNSLSRKLLKVNAATLQHCRRGIGFFFFFCCLTFRSCDMCKKMNIWTISVYLR